MNFNPDFPPGNPNYILLGAYESRHNGLVVGIRNNNMELSSYGNMDKTEYVFRISKAFDIFWASIGGFINLKESVRRILSELASKERCRLYSLSSLFSK